MSERPRLPLFLRLLSFWLGLPVLIFLLWAWRDSMLHAFALNHKHGATLVMAWPPIDREASPPPLPALPSFEIASDLPSLEVPAWGEFGKEVAYFDPNIPADKRMPLAPHRNIPLLPDDPYRNSNRTLMQPYLGLGSAEGVLWLSAWVTPDFPKTPEWTYLAKPSAAPWFAAPEWTRNERFQNSSLRVPYWIIVAAYTFSWLGFIAWRKRRYDKRLGLISVVDPQS